MNERLSMIRDGLLKKGCKLNDCVSERDILDFEEKHNINLPAEYREYLMNISNGGDGPPEYGICALGGTASDMTDEQKVYWSNLENVDKPFPFTKPWVWEGDEESDEGEFEDTENGSIYIGNDGCGMYWHLIVTGPERGNMWLLTGEGIGPTEPKLNYLEWIEAWLNEKEYWG